MPENQTVVVGGEYKESDEHVPNPTDIYDQFNTSGTGSHQVIEDVAPIFQVAKAEAARQAANALDPDHPEPRTSLVMPVAQNLAVVDEEQIAERVRATAEKHSGPVEVGGPSPSERVAALTDDQGEAAAEAETQAQGGVGGSSPATTPAQAATTAPDAGPTSTPDATIGETKAQQAGATTEGTGDKAETHGAAKAHKGS